MGGQGEGIVKAAMGPLLRHEDRYGGDAVASAARRIWTTERARPGPTPDKGRAAEVAELAQIAGWLLFDAGRKHAARHAFADSHTLAVRAGDRPRQWFALDMLAMHAVATADPRQALALSEELLTRPGIPPRVALLARVRQARALAQTGERARAREVMRRARGGLQDSLAPRDPSWTWWVDETEVLGHEAQMLLTLGEPGAAVLLFHRVNETIPAGRAALYHSVAELTAQTHAGAWPEAATTLTRTAHLLTTVSSTRSTTHLHHTLRTLDRKAPNRLSDHIRDTLRAAEKGGRSPTCSRTCSPARDAAPR
ncbi:helix-turn-helix domain-containing protein [Streptomyces sp. 3N207]|uniref:helix-turn-helix domain-containing protein n=1 Tax=Streptomyces sp. 3N207 TaxID=3457417 RepID=UPI003FD00890